ncbi:unnamed protein product [Microthlaspi erraticum]|uniref:BHLH domain-containing protein n=1 Tax=Microthlaspi erraticum TaxID=1685480 RepID=A0A6D2IUI1_9BRAS|nr:unnamed protein product [Microthlaspi erraticum]
MEFGYEFDSLSELPPLPQEFDSMEYSRNYPYTITPLDSLAPFPSSDFTLSTGGFTFSDQYQDLLQLQQQSADSLFLDSALSLFTRDHLSESTRLGKLFHEDVATPFLHLPDLKSFEYTTTDVSAVENTKPFLSLSPPHPEKRRRVGSTFTISPSPSSSSNSKSPARSSSQATFGGDRRKKISDKIRSLEKLMPWEKKMSLATVLEEAHKYIKFLQSQISALRWMPLESVYCTAGEFGESDLLKSLTRQQILQVLANSPGARTVLSTRGECVFSYEQLLSVKMLAQSARNL